MTLRRRVPAACAGRLACLALAAIVLSACASQPPAVSGAPPYTGGGDNEVYVLNHGWHTGFVVPTARISPLLPGVETGPGNTAYLEFGWGDAGFYQARRVGSRLALRAVLIATNSVVYVSPVSQTVSAGAIAEAVARLCLTDTQLSSLIRFIAGSFRRDDSGRLVREADGTAPPGRFYEGIGHYHLWNTCNTWTAKGLASAGMDISTAFRLTADSVMSYLRGHDHVVVTGAPAERGNRGLAGSDASRLGLFGMRLCERFPVSMTRRHGKPRE